MLRPTRTHTLQIHLNFIFFFWNSFIKHIVSLDYPSLCPHKTCFRCTSNSFGARKLKIALLVAEESKILTSKSRNAMQIEIDECNNSIIFLCFQCWNTLHMACTAIDSYNFRIISLNQLQSKQISFRHNLICIAKWKFTFDAIRTGREYFVSHPLPSSKL